MLFLSEMDIPEIPKPGKGTIIDPALCRACRSIKKCRLLTEEYVFRGNSEIYSDMFMDVFGLLLSHLDDDTKESCICATCVARLREASAFRHQVLQSEQLFLQARLHAKDECNLELKVEVKTEPMAECDSDSHEDRTELPEAEPEQVTESEEKPPECKPLVSPTAEGEGAPRPPRRPRAAHRGKLLRTKLHRAVDIPLKQKEKVPPKAKKKLERDHDVMAYENTVTIVHHSYVCPFHNRISNYYCYYCKDQFTNPNELRDHTLTHDPVKMFENTVENKKIPKIDITRIDCRLCQEKIDDLETFKRHITSVHSKRLHPIANEFLKFRLSLDNLVCTECGKTFPYFDSLKKHMVEHFGTLICDICGACFLERNSLRTHIKSHSKVETNFPCEICGKNLKSKYSRYLHVATVHEKKPTVNCYKCDASFLSYALRNRHLIEVHGDKRTFPCKLCDKVYNRRKTLMEHNRRNHLKVMRHQCNLCDQKFYLPSRLKEHMATHTGERNFRCEFCDKSYPRLQSLQEHLRSHNNEKRYKCGMCNAGFTHNSSLKNHLRSHQEYELDSSFN